MLARQQLLIWSPVLAPTTPTISDTDVEAAPRLRAAIGRLHRRLRPTPASLAAGMTPTRVSLLYTVIREGPIRLSVLADMEGVNPTMLSRIVGDLSDAGLLERASYPGDRRAAVVAATEQGRRLATRIRSERTDVLHRALDELEPSDRKALEGALPALERLAEALRRHGTRSEERAS